MKFLECTDEKSNDLKETYNLTLAWEMVVEPCMVEIDDEIVALIDMSQGGMFGENSIEIYKFEVFEKGKGIGSKIITEVLKKSKGKEVYLYAEDRKSKSFWEKHGFEAIDDGSGTKVMQFS
ncbi:GNAT family N-acetyltransferase [Psychrobacillus sp.]|uniref:GNAT family N-acetyltransferase n=1 Tax=Psychrobacillus sp. TaxID=1871623 RepID=UPI0028BEE9AE|nr:GNAT family N-acetyltransferase [Psychrobacillus sp.]